MIRQGQAELQAIRDQAAPAPPMETSSPSQITPSTERSASGLTTSHDQSSNPTLNTAVPGPNSPVIRGSLDVSRRPSRRSRTPSRTASPSFRNASAGTFGQGEDFFSGGRSQSLMDENAYYQAETQNLTRENQMLRQRIRELGAFLSYALLNHGS